MKVRDQIKLKFQGLRPYYDEMVELSKTLPSKELGDHFMEGIKAEIRNELAVASLKIRKEINDELNVEVMKQVAGANPPVNQASQSLTPTQEEIEQRLAGQRENQENE